MSVLGEGVGRPASLSRRPESPPQWPLDLPPLWGQIQVQASEDPVAWGE
jgi:hypothetical protein